MVAIKGIGIQTDCKKCPFMATDGADKLSPMMCVALWATKHETRHCVQGKILDDCPLVEVVTCKDCKSWNKEEKYCEHLANTIGWFVCTSEDFYCKNAERRK